jgi:N utilization substance protein A
MNKDLIAIFEYLEREKGIKREIVVQAIEDSLKAAARKSSHGGIDNVFVNIDAKTGDIEAYVRKVIVETVKVPEEEISLQDARNFAPECHIGQRLEISIPPHRFGRIAAQTARQIISQKLRGAERDVIYEEYRHRVNEIISGTVKQFVRGKNIIVDLGKVEALLPERFYPKTEKFHVGERVQALLFEVRDAENGGAEVILSRSHPEFVVQLFRQEVPELYEGTIAIGKIAREAGYRTKMAVRSSDSKVDPVGTCVGVRGTRIKNIIRELNNEKIDVFPFSEDPVQLLENALEPIQIQRIKIDEQAYHLIVNDEDYPIVIGKKGMNARLLGQLIGKEIDVQKKTEYQKILSLKLLELSESAGPSFDEPLRIEGMSSLLVEAMIGAGFDTLRKVAQANPLDLAASAPGINYLDLADKILEQYKKKQV